MQSCGVRLVLCIKLPFHGHEVLTPLALEDLLEPSRSAKQGIPVSVASGRDDLEITGVCWGALLVREVGQLPKSVCCQKK